MGRKLYNIAQGFYLSGFNQFEVSTEMLESGLYFIEISNKKYTAREKLYIIK
jgi:hypothetical protein